MPSIVTITTGTAELKTGAGAKATQSFTVTNSTGGPLRIGRRIMADPPAEAGWFKPLAAEELDLGPGASQRIDVEVAPGAQAPAGRHAFRLLVFSTARPGEDFTESPSTTLEIAASAAPPPPAPPPWKWIAIAAAVLVLLAVAGVGAWYATRDSGPKVADVTGKAVKEAMDTLTGQGFKPSAARKLDAGKPDGTVIDQDPKPNAKAAAGAAVALTVAAPPMPDLTRKQLADVQPDLDRLGLQAATTFTDQHDAPSGQIMDQQPRAGEMAPERGGSVALTVARQLVTVPPVAAKTLFPDAKAQLEQRGLKVKRTEVDAPTRVVDELVELSPGPGTELASGSEVEVKVSSPQAEIPKLTGVLTDQLRHDLDAKFQLAPVCRTDAAKPANTVVDQFPGPGPQPRGIPLRVEYSSPGICFVIMLPPRVFQQLRSMGDRFVQPGGG